MIRSILGWFGLAVPPWLLPVVIVGAFLASVGAAYVKGRVDSTANCREAALQAEIAALERDRDAARSAEAESDDMASALAAANEKLQQEVDAYAKDLELRPDSRCALTPDDIRRLR